jgi:hypothetical protein
LNVYKSQNESLTNAISASSNVNNVENVKLLERFENNLQVLEDKKAAPVEEKVEEVVSPEKQQLTKLQQDFSNISNIITNTTVKDEKAKEDNSLKEYLAYSIQIQSGMLQLLQQLVDTHQMKRFTDSPIKN